jgi:hypothetical protein
MSCVYRLIAHQCAQKEPCLAPYLIPPDNILRVASFFLPIKQEMAKTVMKQPIFPGID